MMNQYIVNIFSLRKKLLLVGLIVGLVVAAIFFYFHQNKKHLKLPDQATNDFPDNYKDGKSLDVILAANDSINPSKEFGFLANSVNIELIKSISKKLSLSDEEKQEAIDEYYKKRSIIITDIHKGMLSSKEKHPVSTYGIEVYKYNDAVESFSHSMGKESCALIELMPWAKVKNFSKVAMLQIGWLGGDSDDTLCSKILSDLLPPIAKSLQDQALIKDMEIMQVDLQKKIKESILMLATAKASYKFFISNTWIKEGLLLTSDLKINAHVNASILFGLDLTNDFKMSVNHGERYISIDLPQPKELSRAVKLTFGEASEGWFSPEINSDMYNSLNEMARRRVSAYANNDRLDYMAKKNAQVAIMNIFQPLMSLPQFNYNVKVTFNGEKLVVDEKDKSDSTQLTLSNSK